jgi:hypothetical protein
MTNQTTTTITLLINQLEEMNILSVTRDYTEGSRAEFEEMRNQLINLLAKMNIRLSR